MIDLFPARLHIWINRTRIAVLFHFFHFVFFILASDVGHLDKLMGITERFMAQKMLKCSNALKVYFFIYSVRAVFTWLSKGIGFGFGFGFTTPFGWLVYLLWFWFYSDSQVKIALWESYSKALPVIKFDCWITIASKIMKTSH